MEKSTKNVGVTRQPAGIKRVFYKPSYRSFPECLCMAPLRAPIYQCESGHNMCSKCTEQTQVCPICRKHTGKMRNWQLEEIIEHCRSVPECLCMMPLRAPIYQCESGHNMCSKCTEQTQVCPICRKHTGKMRNWQLEEIVEYCR
ncbi:hypothetical protein SFRURICE_001276 [Spodoptera frugiperda]|uniref:SFRICE_036063 n=1 Tax=Spodoptera frugiperda TaxID=7108 RepID=A0A2H1WNM6_SPOFR|nr:hypothetical protein SFRURICE_001276 [Spodoptera frugiperda]